jgi:hypothetical protein
LAAFALENQMKSLQSPRVLRGDPDAVEVARVWIGQDDLHVVLNVGMFGGDDGAGETTAWGDIMADMLRHVAHAIALQEGGDELKHQRALLKRVRESITNDKRTLTGGFEDKA